MKNQQDRESTLSGGCATGLSFGFSQLTRDPISIFRRMNRIKETEIKDKLEKSLEKLRGAFPKNNYKIGAAVGAGDCFFDSVAQGLNELRVKGLVMSNDEFNARSLRKSCKRYAQRELNQSGNSSWLSSSLAREEEYKELYGYIPRIEFTAEDVENAGPDSLVKALKLEYAIWGRPEIEGKMIANEYNVELYFYSINEENGQKVTVLRITANSDDSEVFIEGENLRELRVDSTEKFIGILNHYRLKPKGCKLRWKRGKKLKLLQSYARYIVRLMCIRMFIDVLINNFICHW